MKTFRTFGRWADLLIPSILIAGLCVSQNAHATIITVDFSFLQATTYAGSPAGTQVSGSFSFDDSPYQEDLDKVPAGEIIDIYHFEIGLPTLSLEMDWLGTHWTTSNSSIALLTWGPGRSLEGWIIGGYLNPAICGEGRSGMPCNVFPFTEPDFELDGKIGSIQGTGVIPNDAAELTTATAGTWSVRPDVAVPEPEAMVLFGLGLAALAIAGRRRGGRADTNPRRLSSAQ